MRTGVDVLVDEDFARLKGRRLALITNVTATGTAVTLTWTGGSPTVDVLRSAGLSPGSFTKIGESEWFSHDRRCFLRIPQTAFGDRCRFPKKVSPLQL